MSEVVGNEPATLTGCDVGRFLTRSCKDADPLKLESTLAMQEPVNSNLQSMKTKLAALRDDIRGIALGYFAGLLLWGPPGTSKTWTIKETLRAMGVAWREPIGTITARALFMQLQQFPSDIHLIEDQESLLSDAQAQSVLRAALWTTERTDGRIPDRVIHWDTARGGETLIFSGGIIIVGNVQPPQTQQGFALLTRVLKRELTASTDELCALMRDLASTNPPTIMGYRMSVEESLEVAEFVIAESLTSNTPLNLRILQIASALYVQFQLGDCVQHWHDRVIAQIAGRFAKSPRHGVDLNCGTRLEAQERDRKIVSQIIVETDNAKEQLTLWVERSEKSKSMFYQRKKEVDDLK